MANYWGNNAGIGDLPPYVKAAFQLFRNYDGKHGAFGDTAVKAAPADRSKASLFAATDSKHPGRLTVVAINKDQHASFDAKLDIKGGGYGKAQVYVLDGSEAEVRTLPPVEIEMNHLEYRMPPLSATLFVCTR